MRAAECDEVLRMLLPVPHSVSLVMGPGWGRYLGRDRAEVWVGDVLIDAALMTSKLQTRVMWCARLLNLAASGDRHISCSLPPFSCGS